MTHDRLAVEQFGERMTVVTRLATALPAHQAPHPPIGEDLNGESVAQDYAKAREWFEKAADKGDARAMFNLGWLYENGRGVPLDDVKAREWGDKATKGMLRVR